MVARTPNEVIEDGVRARLQEILVASGVKSSEVALEVLFWLPVGFVREYGELYMRALALGDGSVGENGAKAGEDQGRLVAKVPSKLRGTEKGLSAQGGGKRYKTEWVVKDEQALALKARIDRKLGKLAEEMNDGKEKRGGRQGSRGGGEGGERAGIRGGGGTPGENPRGLGGVDWEFDAKGERARGKCRDCGQAMMVRWARCPFHNA